jgi:hypothetical protein
MIFIAISAERLKLEGETERDRDGRERRWFVLEREKVGLIENTAMRH